MTPNERRHKTIIEKYGSWEAFKNFRYLNPEKSEERKAHSSIIGSLPKKAYPFQNKELASRAGKTKKQTKITKGE